MRNAECDRARLAIRRFQGVVRTRMFIVVTATTMSACAGSGDPQPRVPDGPVASQVRAWSGQRGVPADVVFAVAAVEGGLKLPRWRPAPAGGIATAGILELRRGAFDSLGRAAALTGRSELELCTDTDAGTEAGIQVLSELGARLGARSDDLASWRDAIGELGGFRGKVLRDDYIARVYATVRRGGLFAARDGELVMIGPHPEVRVEATISPPGLRFQAADFPGAIWLDTPQTNKWTPGREDGNAAVDIIVIHDTECDWDAAVATLQNDPNKSCHYLVDADGSRVAQFVSETDTAWQAGNWCVNKHSIGIEHVGVASDSHGYSDGLYAKSAELVQNIRTRWMVPLDRDHIIGHYQVPNGNVISQCSPPCSDGLDACETQAQTQGGPYGGSSNHWDPGYYWQWCQYMERLGASCRCNDAWPLWNCTTDLTEAWRCNNGNLEKQDCSPCEVMPVGTEDVCHQPESDSEPQTEAQPEAQPDAALPDSAAHEAGKDAATESPSTGGDAPSAPDVQQETTAESGVTGYGSSGGDEGGCGCEVPEGAGPRSGMGLLSAITAMVGLRLARRRTA